MIDSFVDISRLMTAHCANEIKELFDIPGNYNLEIDEETEILQAIYKKLLHNSQKQQKQVNDISTDQLTLFDDNQQVEQQHHSAQPIVEDFDDDYLNNAPFSI